MDEKIKILLDKIGYSNDRYSCFSHAKLSKIVVNKNKSAWVIYIENDDYFDLDILEELEDKISLLDPNTENFTIIYDIKNKDNSYLLNYYPYLLKLLKNDLVVLEIYKDCLKYEDNKLLFVVSNTIEESKLDGCMDKIEKFFKKFGYKCKKYYFCLVFK